MRSHPGAHAALARSCARATTIPLGCDTTANHLLSGWRWPRPQRDFRTEAVRQRPRAIPRRSRSTTPTASSTGLRRCSGCSPSSPSPSACAARAMGSGCPPTDQRGEPRSEPCTATTHEQDRVLASRPASFSCASGATGSSGANTRARGASPGSEEFLAGSDPDRPSVRPAGQGTIATNPPAGGTPGRRSRSASGRSRTPARCCGGTP